MLLRYEMAAWKGGFTAEISGATSVPKDSLRALETRSSVFRSVFIVYNHTGEHFGHIFTFFPQVRQENLICRYPRNVGQLGLQCSKSLFDFVLNIHCFRLICKFFELN